MEDLLEALRGGEPGALIDAIKKAARVLGSAEEDVGEGSPLVQAIARHRDHPEPKVREAIAEAYLHFPDASFEQTNTRLLQDPNEWVRIAAVRTYDERSRRQRIARQCEERSAEIHRLRARIKAAADGDAEVLRLADQLADRSVGQFVDRLLHEITKVTTPLDLALAEVQAHVRAGALDRLHLGRSADQARAALQVLLRIAKDAKSQAREAAPKFRAASVRGVVDEQTALFQKRIDPDRGRRLALEVEVDERLTFDVDRGLFAQALSNLLQNAAEAYAAAGDDPVVVRVSAEMREGGTLVAVAVTDRGVGIRASDVPNLGEPFHSSKGQGRGLGLLNVRKMVEMAHGGTLEIETERGVGTTMTLVVPRKQERGRRR
jgi:signal transduction histidine kinase